MVGNAPAEQDSPKGTLIGALETVRPAAVKVRSLLILIDALQ